MVDFYEEEGNTQEKPSVPKPSGAVKGTVRKRSPKLKPKITLKKLAKSRTNKFNVIIAPAILTILTSFGIIVPLPVIISGYAVVNFILRLVTKGGIAEK